MNADLIIERKGKDNLPVFLFDDPNKKRKIWDIWDSKSIPPMFSSEKPSNAHVPPEVEEIIDQDYFHASFGETTFLHGKRVYNSPNVDCRTEGFAQLCPKIAKSTITLATNTPVYALRNHSFEENATTTWSTSGTGTPVHDVVDVVTVSIPDGTYCSRLRTTGGAGAWTGTVYQNFENYTGFKSKSITVTASLYGSGAGAGNNLVITIDDGVGTTSSADYDTAAWASKSVTRVIDASATRVRIAITYTASSNRTWYFDNFTITVASSTPMTKAPVVKIENFAGTPYAAAGYYLLKWDGTDWDSVAAFNTTITSICEWGAYLFIALGISTLMWYYNGTTFTKSTISAATMNYLATVGATLWGVSSLYEVKSATNPLNGGSWSAATSIISSTKVITNLVSHDDIVTVATRDGFYEVEAAGTIASLIPDLNKALASTTGQCLTYWRGNFYVNSGLGAFYEHDYADAVNTTLTPLLYAPEQTDFDGIVMSSEADDSTLYTFMDNATKVEILGGKWLTIEDETGENVTAWYWYHMGEITLTDTSNNVRCSKLITYSGTRTLWIGCSHDTDGIYYILPDTYMETAGDLLTSWHEGKYKHVLKTFFSVSVRTDNCSATKTITVYYKKEHDSSFTSLGAITSDTDTTLLFTDYVTTKKLQLKFSFASDSETESPQLLGYTLRCLSRPFDLETSRLTINEYGEFSVYGGYESGWQHREYPDFYKNWYSISVLSEGLTDSKYLTVQYKVDDDTDYTTLDEVFCKSPYQTIYLPELTGKFLKLRFDLSSPSDTSMIAYVLGGKIRPEVRKEMEFIAYVASEIPRPTGSPYKCNVFNYLKELREIREKNYPVKLKTFDGQELYVTLENLKETLYLDAIKGKEYIVTINALEAKIKG